MNHLKLESDKSLRVLEKHPIFDGEHDIDSVYIDIDSSKKIADKSVGDCTFKLHVVFPDQSYLEYDITFTGSGSIKTATIPVTSDWTLEPQKLKLFIEITYNGTTALGYSTSVELEVCSIINEALRIVDREELVSIIANILESKIENAAGAVKSSHIDTGAVTSNKIPNYAVDFSKLSAGVQETINTHTTDIGNLKTGKLAFGGGSTSETITKATLDTITLTDDTVYKYKLAEGFLYLNSPETFAYVIQIAGSARFFMTVEEGLWVEKFSISSWGNCTPCVPST